MDTLPAFAYGHDRDGVRRSQKYRLGWVDGAGDQDEPAPSVEDVDARIVDAEMDDAWL